MKSKTELNDFEMCVCGDRRYMHIDSADECFSVGCTKGQGSGRWWISKCHRFRLEPVTVSAKK